MKLVMTLLVLDEEEIVADNLDFHLAQGVDEVIVTDNGSVDGTLEILRAYEARGLVRIVVEPTDDYSQGRWVTRMARMAATETSMFPKAVMTTTGRPGRLCTMRSHSASPSIPAMCTSVTTTSKSCVSSVSRASAAERFQVS